MTKTVLTPPSLRPKTFWQEWPMPSTIITQTPPNQYFPQGPIGR